MKIAFAAKAHVYDLVSGRYFGHTDTVELPVFNENLSVMLTLLKEKALPPKVTVKGSTVTALFSKKYAAAVNIRLFDPAGKEVKHYNKRLAAENGAVIYTVPFAPSDAKGKWLVLLTDVITRKTILVLLTR